MSVVPVWQLSAKVTKVEIVGGDAHVICVSNKIKHIFDFNVKLNFSLEIDESMGLPSQSEVCVWVRRLKYISIVKCGSCVRDDIKQALQVFPWKMSVVTIAENMMRMSCEEWQGRYFKNRPKSMTTGYGDRTNVEKMKGKTVKTVFVRASPCRCARNTPICFRDDPALRPRSVPLLHPPGMVYDTPRAPIHLVAIRLRS